VSLYTLTKGVAAGAYLVPLLLLFLGVLDSASPLWVWGAPIVAGVFLGVTGMLLIWDLEHPLRFYMIFTKAQWQSWLVRGAFIIGGYSAVLGLHFLTGLLDKGGAREVLALAGLPLALMTAVYTAYLFAQAKARDLWQSPLLPPHLAVQTLLAGAAALVPVAFFIELDAVKPLLWILGGTSATHLLFVLGETTLTHSTAHAHLATWEMVHGRYKTYFWLGALLVAAGAAAPWIGVGVAPIALLGLLCFEHAYVQAGQAVPLA
jgi:Ni/Fe-hydrogenase subunit HybB-like protein